MIEEQIMAIVSPKLSWLHFVKEEVSIEYGSTKMGQERWYIALPASCDLLKRARQDPEFGEYLNSPSIFEKGGLNDWHFPGFPGEEVFHEFCEAVKQMNVEHPGIAARVFTLNRAFDKVHYLISEARRTGEEYIDLGSKAILGATALPPHLTGSQGFSSRYSPPEEVTAIAAWMSGLTQDALRSCYFPEDMAQHVYKFSYYPGNPEEAFLQIWEYFDDFRAFYREVALHGEAILTTMD